jgi:hypothetical protein
MTEKEIIRQAMSLLGKRTSDRKKASSRANSKRPRKKRKLTDSNKDAKRPKVTKISENKV